MLRAPTEVVVTGADGRKSTSAVGGELMRSSGECVRLQNSARRPPSAADESILKSSHPSSGKFAIFGHHHLLRRAEEEL
jgi:hypothetical protein